MHPRLSGLWQNDDFLKLWAGQSISMLGTQISLLALPLAAVLTLHATPAQMGLLTAAGTLPGLLVGLFAGVWVDRHGRRPLLISTNLGRALVLLVVPAAALMGLLRIELLYAVALASGLLGGLLGTVLGVRGALGVAVAGLGLSSVIIVCSPLRVLREQPSLIDRESAQVMALEPV